jgi:Holliday junction DNA helicase RuvB
MHRETDAGRRGLAFYLAELSERRVYLLLGFSSAEHYAEARMDMARRTARELIRAGRDLLELPVVDGAFCDGKLSWTKVRLLLRVVEPETEAGWVELAESVSARELERQVRRSRKGDIAGKRSGMGIGTITIRFTANLVVLAHARVEKAREKVAAILGEEVSDELLMDTLAGAFLETSSQGQDREGHGPFQIVASRNVAGEVEIETPDGLLPVDAATAEMMVCDAGVQAACDCKPPEPFPFGQDAPTPPALRRRVLARDGYQCRCCRNPVSLHAHHIHYRRNGGPTTASNLVALCQRCHTLVHEGLLVVRGVAPDKLEFLDRRGRDLQRWEPGVRRVVREQDTSVPLSASEPDLTIDRLPAHCDRAWWRRHEHLMEWNDRRGTLELHPGRPLPELPPERDEPAAVAGPDSRTLGADAAAREEIPHADPADRPDPSGPTLDQVIGQKRVVRALSAAVRAAQIEHRPVVHTLLHGPAGCGKTTLAQAIGRSLGVPTHVTSGPALTTPSALIGLLFGLEANDILFIDEIHGLPRLVGEILYEVMEGQSLSLPISQGVRGRTLTLRLPPVTIVGATTEQHLLASSLLTRFPLEETIERYTDDELAQIITLAGHRRGRLITEDAALILARASLGTPRRAKALLSRTCDLTTDLARARQPIDTHDAEESLAAAGIDSRGLGPDHQRALRQLRARNRPLGIGRLAALLGLSPKAFRATLEPELLRLGLVNTTPRGLVAAG